jgi:hypothetical protein
MKPSFVALLLVSAISVGCGDDPPTAPTPRPLINESISEVTVQAQSSACVTFRQEAPGPAFASAGGVASLELGTGTCTSRGAVVGRTERGLDLSLLLAVGDHYVRIENPTRFDFTYRVTLRYLILV